jgi:hypothetical protein
MMTTDSVRKPRHPTTNSCVLDRLQPETCLQLRWLLTASGLRMRWSLPPIHLDR